MENKRKVVKETDLHKMRWYNSVVTQFLIVISFSALVVLVTTTYFSYTKVVETLKDTQAKSQIVALHNLAKEIDQVVYIYSHNLEILGNSHAPRHFLTDVYVSGSSTAHKATDILKNYTDQKTIDKTWKQIDLLDANGSIYASTKTLFSTSTQQTFDIDTLGDSFTYSDGIRIYDIVEYRDIGSALAVVAPIYSIHGEESIDRSDILVGYIVGYLSPEALFKDLGSYADNITTTQETSLYVLNKNGKTVYQNSTTTLYINKEDTEIYDSFFNATDTHAYVIEENTNGKNFYITHAHLDGHETYKGFDWLLLAQTNASFIKNTIRTASLKNIYYYAIAVLFATVFVFSYIAVFILKPLNKINTHIKESILSGKSTPITLNKKGEIGMLIYGYNLLVRQMEERAQKLRNTVLEAATLNKELEKTKEAILNILEDLDEEKRLVDRKVEERTGELLSERQKLSHITENMRVGVILINNSGTPVFVNKQGKSMLGIKNNEKEALTILKKKFKDEKIDEFLHSCALGESAQIAELQNEDGIFEITFKCETATDRISDGFAGKGIWIRDITEAKQLEHSKSELVAVASHQLRTPLTVTRGNLEMLLDELFGRINKKQKELLSDSQESVIRLIGMVNDMLDITKIEKGTVELNIEPVNVTDLINTVTQNMSDYIERHHFTVHVLETSEPVMVRGDREKLIQVFQNLIDNAIKYGKKKKGKVEVSVNANKGIAEITIADNGIGIPPIEQKGIFQRFYRASNAVRFSSGGSGLGLFIVKSFIEQMKGTITFSSKQNQGTTFVIKLPLEQ